MMQFIEREVNLAEKNQSVLIVSNWQQRRLSLISIFNTLTDNSVITAVDFVHTWTNLSERQADVLVIDRWSPSDDITELVKEIKLKYPGTRILVLDCFAQRNRSFNLYPADIVLESDLPSNQIVEAVRQLLSASPPAPLQPETQNLRNEDDLGTGGSY
jgi:DNA-binding NarL/FixJ family response regulator